MGFVCVFYLFDFGGFITARFGLLCFVVAC